MRCPYLALVLLIPVIAGLEVNKFLLVSQPKLHRVVYTQIRGIDVDGSKGNIRPLVEEGLKFPQGLAVDNNARRRSTLYVADPVARCIFSYQLTIQNGRLLAADTQGIVADNIEARWVAADNVGSVYFTDEANSLVMRVDPDKSFRAFSKPYAIYDALDSHHVSAPGGVATDNYNVFWTNKALGTEVGSVVSGIEHPPMDANVPDTAQPLAKNLMKVFGVCVTSQNVFYTNEEKAIYGVKKKGGRIAAVNEGLDKPRGCTWDGDGTVFLADKGNGAVYEFPGNMRQITHMQLTKVIDAEDAFGVAVVSGSRRAFLHVAAWVMGLALGALRDIALL